MTLKCLALDAAQSPGGMALVEDGRVRIEEELDPNQGVGVELFRRMAHMLSVHGWRPEDLNLIVVTLGPGSFTGLRVAMGITKGLAMVRGIPVVGLSTLRLLANAMATTPSWIVPLLDARRGELYFGLYREDDPAEEPREVHPPELGSVARLMEVLHHHTGEEMLHFTGAGLNLYSPELKERLGDRFLVTPLSFQQPGPGLLGQMGLEYLRQGKVLTVETMEPLYLKRSEAELNRSESQT